MTAVIPPTPLAPGGSIRVSALVAADLAGALELPQTIRAAIATHRAWYGQVIALQAEAARWPLGWRDGVAAGVGKTGARRMVTDPEALLAEAEAIIAAGERHERLRALTRGAFEEAGRQLESSCSETVVVRAIGAGLEALFETVRALPPDAPTTAEAALDAPQGQVQAYRVLQTAVSRYRALAEAMREARGRFPAQRDPHNLFTDCQVGPELSLRHRVLPTTPAGPSDPLSRLLWLAHEGQGWAPTAAQQDEAFAAWLAAGAEPEAA